MSKVNVSSKIHIYIYIYAKNVKKSLLMISMNKKSLYMMKWRKKNSNSIQKNWRHCTKSNKTHNTLLHIEQGVSTTTAIVDAHRSTQIDTLVTLAALNDARAVQGYAILLIAHRMNNIR